MHNQRGFVGLPVLIWIVLGLIVVGGGAYYVMHQQSSSPTLSDNATQTLSTTGTNTNFSASPTSGTAPLKVRFMMNGKANTFHTFDFGDGAKFSVGASNDFDNVSCTAAGPDSVCSGTHTYTAQGVYTAKITDSNGVLLGSAKISVNGASNTRASAIIDQDSLTSNSGWPTITGTVSNATELMVFVAKGNISMPPQYQGPGTIPAQAWGGGGTFNVSGNGITMKNGHWSITLNPPGTSLIGDGPLLTSTSNDSPVLQSGTYTIGIYADSSLLTSGSLVINPPVHVKVGDTVEGLTVASVKNTPTGDSGETIWEIKFTGTATVIGSSVGVMGGGGQMILQKIDNSNLPRFILDNSRSEVYFTTGDDLPGDGKRYLATVSDYTMYIPSDPKAWNTDGGHVLNVKPQ